jgi:hypothetical protein
MRQMPNLHYTLVKNEEGERNLTVFFPGEGVKPAHESHPNFEAILEGVFNDDPTVIDLFDVALTAGTKFENLSERVTVANGRVYFDGVEMNTVLTNQIVTFIREGEDFGPLVNFYEKIEMNPNEHSREHLYKFIQVNEDNETGAFTITDDGNFIAYKGVSDDGNGGYVSGSSGKATVDGEVIVGQIPNAVGSVVEMPRDEVRFDPNNHCSTGLHVGTFPYASTFANGAMLKVLINPRDVVSVPNDSAEKMRVCRYKVVEIIEAPETAVVVPAEDDMSDTDLDLRVGDVFQDTDKRRSGRKLKVVGIESGVATVAERNMLGKYVTSKRPVRVDRLLSRKYKRVRRGRKQA